MAEASAAQTWDIMFAFGNMMPDSQLLRLGEGARASFCEISP